METYPLSSQKRSFYLESLLFYGLEKELISADDLIYARNILLDIMDVDEFIFPYNAGEEMNFRKIVKSIELNEILDILLDDANSRELFSPNTTLQRDLFDTKLMNALMPRPSEVVQHFDFLYKTENAECATEYFYELSQDSNYIRRDRIKKDLKWKYQSKYGKLDVTINLSKPEKDPRDIAMAGLKKSSSYPQCALCKEAVGYRGRADYPARQNHRTIPLELNSELYYFQYSPYVYYNEHCIVFNSEHRPMQVSKDSITALIDFLDIFPHYFIGSNADLPIVGGSILSHDHFQGGRYVFPMDTAGPLKMYQFKEFPDVTVSRIKWPLTCFRLRSDNRKELILLADKIQKDWREYSDENFEILAHSVVDGVSIAHNTVTPIARRKGKNYELDLVLRNNRCDDRYPLGIFHPHQDKHHIKKENIGLIEVMGLAVLPARIKDEIDLLIDAYNDKLSFDDERIIKHKEWFLELINAHSGEKKSNEEVRGLIEEGIGKVFELVLEDCAVFPLDKEGLEASNKFIEAVGGSELRKF